MRLTNALLLFSCAASNAADVPDLTDYKTVATAVQTKPRALAGPPKQPGHLGVRAESDAARGLHVASVESNSPAEKAGMLTGDRILAIDGKEIRDVAALREVILTFVEGDVVTVRIRRDDISKDVSVTLSAPSRPLSLKQRAILGIHTQSSDHGLKISAVNPGLPADKIGLKVGDVLVKVGATDVTTYTRLHDVLGGLLPGQKVTLGVRRDGKDMTVDCELAADPAYTQPEDRPTLARWDDNRGQLFRGDVYNLAVIPIGFADIGFNTKISAKDWDRALFSQGEYYARSATGQATYGSVNDYFLEVSCGKLRVTGRILKSVMLNKKLAEYSAPSAKNAVFTDTLDKLLNESGADALAGFDGLLFLHAGKRVPSPRGSVFWPHRSTLRHRGRAWAYFFVPEMMAPNRGEQMTSTSVFCHEFGHMLGLPDLYAKPEAPSAEGVGVWCTMSTGHGTDGKPLHLSAWCKEQLGWLKPCVIDPTTQQKLILAPVEGSTSECYKVLMRADGSEYLLLENRKRQLSDRALPGEGLLIWRVVDGRPLLEESHGIAGPDGPTHFLGTVPYPSPSNTAFTPYTQPSSKPVKFGGLPVHITNILRLPDGRVTFHIGYEYL